MLGEKDKKTAAAKLLCALLMLVLTGGAAFADSDDDDDDGGQRMSLVGTWDFDAFPLSGAPPTKNLVTFNRGGTSTISPQGTLGDAEDDFQPVGFRQLEEGGA